MADKELSRRSLFKQAGSAGAAAALSGTALGTGNAAAATPAPAAAPEALETLNATEAETLEAIVARLIPSDANGPGATEARAAHYIDRALAGPLRSLRSTYAAGLAAIDEHAQNMKGAVFAKLPPQDQDGVLRDIEANRGTGFIPSAAGFFTLLRTHTIEGTFCDPYYGGNANFIGWALIGYPGIRMGVTTDDQRLDRKPEPLRKSAYDDAMFGKAGDHGHQP